MLEVRGLRAGYAARQGFGLLQAPVQKRRGARRLRRVVRHPMDESHEVDAGGGGLLQRAPRHAGRVALRGFAHPLHRAADAQQPRDLDVQVPRLELAEDHLACYPAVRTERRQPVHDHPVQALRVERSSGEAGGGARRACAFFACLAEELIGEALDAGGIGADRNGA